jgi:hypothetical protein
MKTLLKRLLFYVLVQFHHASAERKQQQLFLTAAKNCLQLWMLQQETSVHATILYYQRRNMSRFTIFSLFTKKKQRERQNKQGSRVPSMMLRKAPAAKITVAHPLRLNTIMNRISSSGSIVSNNSVSTVSAKMNLSSSYTVPLQLTQKLSVIRQHQRRASFGHRRTMDIITYGRRHYLRAENHPSIVGYYADSALYPIPEHGSGVCFMRYTTRYNYGACNVWWIDELSNTRPHHRRSPANIDFSHILSISSTIETIS